MSEKNITNSVLVETNKMKIIDKRNVKLDFGTFKLYRIELLEDKLKDKYLKIFYKVKEKHAEETSVTQKTICNNSMEEYIAIAKDYQIKSLDAIGMILPTPNGLIAKLTD